MRIASLPVILGICVLLAGCGDNKAEVKGVVKLDGVPIADGSIRFEAEDGKSAVSGGTIANGAYAVKNVAPVNMKVSFTASKVVGKKPLYGDPKGPFMEVKENTIPEKYSDQQTELRFEVKPGPNQKDWDLTSK